MFSKIKYPIQFSKLLSFLLFLFFLQGAWQSSWAFPQISNRVARVFQEVEFGFRHSKLENIEKCGAEKIYGCIRILIKSLEVDDLDIRHQSAVSLGKIGLKKAVAPLQNAIQKVDQELVEQKKEAEEAKKLYPDKVKSVEEANKFEKLLKIKSDMIRAIGYTRDSNASKYLESFLTTSPYPKIRGSAAYALKFTNNGTSTMVLIDSLKKETVESVRADILRILIKYDRYNVEHINRIINLLASDDPVARYNSANIALDFRLSEAQRDLKDALTIESIEKIRKVLYKAYRNSFYY